MLEVGLYEVCGQSIHFLALWDISSVSAKSSLKKKITQAAVQGLQTVGCLN